MKHGLTQEISAKLARLVGLAGAMFRTFAVQIPYFFQFVVGVIKLALCFYAMCFTE